MVVITNSGLISNLSNQADLILLLLTEALDD